MNSVDATSPSRSRRGDGGTPFSRRASLLLLWFLGALGVWAMAAVALLRFDTGAAYPRYSSFRPDPVGTKALYAALSDLPGLEVGRNFEPIDQLARLYPGAGTTLLFAGADADEFEADGAAAWSVLRALAGAGARVVVAFAPAQGDAGVASSPSRDRSPVARDSAEDDAVRGWAPRFEHAPLAEDDQGRPRTARAALTEPTAHTDLPAAIACTSSLWFASVHTLQPGWRVVYARGERPVVIERRVGAGTLVLVADAFALSNESLRFGRETQFVAWALGLEDHPAPSAVERAAGPGPPVLKTRVIFDETHLGTTAPAGTMALARRYRLHWFFATLVVLALLFVWRAASPLVPESGPTPDAVVAGRDALAGISGLLRRGLARHEIMPAAVEAWRRSTAPSPALAAAAAGLARSSEDPVEVYRRIRSLVDKGRQPRSNRQSLRATQASQDGRSSEAAIDQRTIIPEDSDAARN